MSQSCAGVLAGRPISSSSLRVHSEFKPGLSYPKTFLLRQHKVPHKVHRRRDGFARWTCSLNQPLITSASCQKEHVKSMTTVDAVQAKGCGGAASVLSWLPKLPVVLLGACLFCVGAAQADMTPEDCAALIPAEQALDSAFGIDADSHTVIVAASVLEAVGLIGAIVGGIIARNRKDETDRLNQQLRQINLQLRKQARMESYAPGLSYAPVSVASGRLPLPTEAAVENGVSHERAELLKRLKTGKKWLREQRPALALEEFKIALGLARQAQDPVCEKKAARGLGASCQRLCRYKEAIGYHEIVLKTSERAGDSSGDTDAYGAIADCYTEMGDLENAGKFYDQYISRLQSNESVDLDN